MILTQHKRYYDDIFEMDLFWRSPFVMFGAQDISRDFDSKRAYKSFKHFLLDNKPIMDVYIVDYADERADIHLDMNYPIPEGKLPSEVNVFCDIGCLEHVFDTKRCLHNCMSMLNIGGIYILHTPVSGYHRHGLYTFNPAMLIWTFEHNGFDIIYLKYSYKSGQQAFEFKHNDVLIWMVAIKKEPTKTYDKFVMPIQDRRVPFHPSKHIL